MLIDALKRKRVEQPKPRILRKIRILQPIAGNRDSVYGLDWDFSFAPGQEVDIDERLATSWIESGVAEAAPETVV